MKSDTLGVTVHEPRTECVAIAALRRPEEHDVIDVIDGYGSTTRQRILHAAARQFAVLPYSQVNVDEVVAAADVSKSALYVQFRSKLALATALVELHLDMSWNVAAKRIGLGLGGLEALIDFSYLTASADMGHHLTRAAFNLLESVGRFDGVQTRVMDTWVHTFTDVATRGVAEADIRADCDPELVARLLTSLYVGLRQTSDLDLPERFIADLESVLLLALPGFANSARLPYFTAFVRRRSVLAIKNAAPMGADKL